MSIRLQCKHKERILNDPFIAPNLIIKDERRVSFSETTHVREDRALLEDVTRKLSSGDEVFETLEVRRRLTIVPPGTLSGEEEDDEHMDIAYDDELIYDEDHEDIDDNYERYSDEDEIEEDPEVIPDDIPTPETFEELNALYRPKFEEKLTTIAPRTRPEAGVQMLPPEGSSTVDGRPKRSPPVGVINNETSLRATDQLTEPPSPRRSPQPPPPPPQVEDEFNEEDDYSDDLYEGEVESDVDDEDLMRRLEEKYGKLPHGEEDEIGDSELEGEEEEEEDDPSWTSKVK